jgi:hypothetical protein
MMWSCLAKVNSSETLTYIPMYPHSGKDNTRYEKSGLQTFVMKKVDTTNFCILKKRTPQNLVMLKADTTNFSRLKKRTLQTFVRKKVDTTSFCGLKKQTLSTFVMKKSTHY